MTRDEAKSEGRGRRHFLKLVGVGAAAGTAGAATAGPAVAAGDEPVPMVRGGGYRESEHVRKVYELARF